MAYSRIISRTMSSNRTATRSRVRQNGVRRTTDAPVGLTDGVESRGTRRRGDRLIRATRDPGGERDRLPPARPPPAPGGGGGALPLSPLWGAGRGGGEG